jgi:hypothetical protein
VLLEKIQDAEVPVVRNVSYGHVRFDYIDHLG